MAADRDDFVFQAKLAEQAERYEEMCEYMRKVASLETEMSVEERNLLSVAYKNAVGARRASWRALTLAERKYADAGNLATVGVDRLKVYRAKIESELEVYCGQLVDVIDAKVLPVSTSLESKVFFYKLKGDYARYLAEFAFGDHRKEVAEKALETYRTATELAKDLFATHPVRLGLALNFSVFYYEILNSLPKACALAKVAFDEAIAGLDTLNEESYKDSTLIMQLLRDNLTLWSKELDEQSRAQTEVAADEQAN